MLRVLVSFFARARPRPLKAHLNSKAPISREPSCTGLWVPCDHRPAERLAAPGSRVAERGARRPCVAAVRGPVCAARDICRVSFACSLLTSQHASDDSGMAFGHHHPSSPLTCCFAQFTRASRSRLSDALFRRKTIRALVGASSDRCEGGMAGVVNIVEEPHCTCSLDQQAFPRHQRPRRLD